MQNVRGDHESRVLLKINPFSPGSIVEFSQLEPILFFEQAWENFSFNLQ